MLMPYLVMENVLGIVFVDLPTKIVMTLRVCEEGGELVGYRLPMSNNLLK